MSDSKTLSAKPIVHYPRVAQVGKTYLMTIDLEVEEGFEWQYEEEEYAVYCSVESELFSSKPVGEPVVVLHRFGGSYGTSRFLLTAIPEEVHGSIQVTLVNKWGVTTKVINLEQVKVVNEKLEDSAIPIFTYSNSRIEANNALNTGAPSDRPSTQSQSQDDLFQQVKERCRQKILSQHSRMQLLSGEEIGVDQLYVDVWLLNRSPRTVQISTNKLLQTFDLRNDRLGLGDRIKRNPGFEVADDNPKLVILGKPGAGKTTFLKHLAIDWCKGQFQPDSIAVLIELRQIRDGRWELLDAIGKELELKDRQQIEVLLQEGRLLVLMDGLNEVPINALRQTVQAQLQQVARDYPTNRFILTCRTQIITSISDGFTSVEVADFSAEQIEQFVRNWFTANGKTDAEAAQHWEMFERAVSRNPALKELAVIPVLLSFMCLVLQDEGDIPLQVNWLYERGIKLLLSKWNDAKYIDEWEVGSKAYRKLGVEQKEALLSELAVRKFEDSNNFVLFRQAELVQQITQFLNLSSRQDGESVLRAIEAQHGLLVERADELWSFSHLAFQEYFVARNLTTEASDNGLTIQELASRLIDQRWQKVIHLTCNMLPNADALLISMKAQIDQILIGDERLQHFLQWIDEQAQSANSPYSLAATRAFYFAFTQEISINNQICFKLDEKFHNDFESLYETTYGFFARPDELSREFVCLLFMNKFTNGYFNSLISAIELPNRDYLPNDDEDNL